MQCLVTVSYWVLFLYFHHVSTFNISHSRQGLEMLAQPKSNTSLHRILTYP